MGAKGAALAVAQGGFHQLVGGIGLVGPQADHGCDGALRMGRRFGSARDQIVDDTLDDAQAFGLRQVLERA